MIKKMTQVGFLFFIAFSFFHCADDAQLDPVPDDADARRRMSPTANAGLDAVITLPTNTIKLDGSASTPKVGTIKSYLWSNLSGPTSPSITNPASAITNVTNLIEGKYTFRLEVTNDRGNKGYDDVIVTVKKSAVIAGTLLPTPSTGETYFIGNMDNVSLSNGNLNGWDGLKSVLAQSIFFNNQGGSQYAFQDVRKDPVDGVTNVLYAQTIDDDPSSSGTARAQMTIKFKDPLELPVYHTSHRMYLNPDIAYLSNYPSTIGWFTLYEIWNKPNSAWGGSTTGSCRWNLSLFKASGAGKPLYWHVEAEKMQPSSENYMWRVDNKTAAIPFGQWFTVDIYLKRGEGSNGRFTVKITVDGEATTTLFDVANTTIYPGSPELQIKEWQPFKLYTSDAVLDWMRNNNKKISAYYNNLVWYKN